MEEIEVELYGCCNGGCVVTAVVQVTPSELALLQRLIEALDASGAHDGFTAYMELKKA